MRTHSQIIVDAGGYQGLAEKIGWPKDRVRFWERRRNIPLEAWPDVEKAGVAAQDELREAAVTAAREKARLPSEAAA